MAESILILPLETGHFTGIRACLDEVAREEKYIALTEAPSELEARLYLSDMLSRRCPYMVAVDGGSVIGWADINILTLPGFGHSGRFGMGLLAAYRGKGIGTRLLQEVVAVGRQRGLTRIELEVFAGNAAAIRMYERAGFVMEGRKRMGRILHGHPEDILQMALIF